MLREKETEMDGTLHPDSQSGLSEAQLEVLVLLQLDQTGPLTLEPTLVKEKPHSHQKTPKILDTRKALTMSNPRSEWRSTNRNSRFKRILLLFTNL